jgi:hypothetical protein
MVRKQPPQNALEWGDAGHAYKQSLGAYCFAAIARITLLTCLGICWKPLHFDSR